MEGRGVLISTLGTEPQVLTLALVALLNKGIQIKEAIGLYTQGRSSPLRRAVKTLREEWPSLDFPSACTLRLIDVPIQDLDSQEALKMAYKTVRTLLSYYKERDMAIHLNISGGRKPLALCAFVAAQFLFSDSDHLWYLFSDKSLIASRRLFPSPNDRYHLLELPVPHWTEVSPLLDALSQYDDPWIARSIQQKLLHHEEQKRWEAFLTYELTPSEREVVLALLHHGGTNQELGATLNKSPRTIEHQLASVFRKLRAFLSWPKEVTVDRTTLVGILAPYIRGTPLSQLGEKPDDSGSE